jgi:hypothetical protein
VPPYARGCGLPARCHSRQRSAGFHPAEVTAAGAAAYDSAADPLVLRSRDEIARFLDGFTSGEPGLVQVPLWRPEAKPRPKALQKMGMYAALGLEKLTAPRPCRFLLP